VDLRWTHLQDTNLGFTTLREANLQETNLSGADLSNADLHGANLFRTNLNLANLNDADLREAQLYMGDLDGASLRGSQLGGTIFNWVNFGRADISSAILYSTVFANVDLSQVKGMKTVFHTGPSDIGISTIFQSKGQIPAEFLRGAGIPDNFVEFMGSLVGEAFQFYSCFISYSGKDEEFARRIHADLQDNGVRCWFAPHDMQSGKKLHEQIDMAIRIHERLLLILSPNSINSEWVKTEISKARKREIKEGKRVLFPILLNMSFDELKEWECFDADRGKDSAREIREYFIPDFTRWKEHEYYQEKFNNLLRDLKKDTAIAATA